MPNAVVPRVVVFASSVFVQNVLAYLSQEGMLAGVVLPDPSELGAESGEVNSIAAQLQCAGVPFQMCCKEKLPLIVQQLDAWNANVGVIATYPHILPEEIIHYFSSEKSPSNTCLSRDEAVSSCFGLYNLHASKLPDYAGPNPIYWQIRNCEKETAMVLHRAEKEPDSGNICCEKILPIHSLDTLASLTNRLAYEAAGLVSSLVESLITSGKPPQDTPQKEKAKTFFSHRTSMENSAVNFNDMDAGEISAMCRAGNGLVCGAIVTINDVTINVMQATPVERETYGTKPGTIVFIGDPEGLIVCVKNGALRLDILSGPDGIYSGFAFAERFHLDAGSCFSELSPLKKQA